MRRTIPILAVALLASSAAAALAGGERCREEAKAAKAAKAKSAYAQASAKEYRCAENLEACLSKKASELAAKGWLGIRTEKNESGTYTVAEVTPGSPAAQTGFAPGDVLVAMNGIPLKAENKERLKAAKASLGVGKTVTYTVERRGNKRELSATLAPVPREVLAQWVGEHALEHHLQVAMAP